MDTSGTSSAITTAKPLGEHRYVNKRKRRKSDEDSLRQVPIDVAVKEPRPRIVSLESDRDIIIREAEADHVTHDGVVVVVRRATRAADDVEDMSVQVDWVLMKKEQTHGDQHSWHGRRRLQTHRSAGGSASSTTRKRDLNALISPESVDTSVREELRRRCSI